MKIADKYYSFPAIAVFIIIFLLFTPDYFAQSEKDSSVTITISAVGDLMCHSYQYLAAQTGPDSFDFNPVYRLVKKYLSDSDFTFGNFETVTAGKDKKYSGYPRFNSPDEYIAALKNAGFDLLSTANNHAFDRGVYGVLRTIKVLSENKINYNGTFISQRDRDSIRIFNIKGIRVAFLAYTYGTNGNPVPNDKSYLINKIEFNLIRSDILKAREENAEIVLVHFHFGTQYKREPDQFEKNIVDSTIKYGADIIIGAHPHVIQPLQLYKTNNTALDTGLIAYSLGNFLSNQRWRYSDCGVILKISITKNIFSRRIFISKIDYVPTWVYKGITRKGNVYEIIPLQYFMSDNIYNSFSKEDFRKMFEAFNDTKKILQKYSVELPYTAN